MTMLPGAGSGEHGPAELVQFGSGRRAHRRWMPGVVLACLFLAAVGSVVARVGRQTGSSAHIPAPPPVRVIAIGHRLLGVTAGWQLFARGQDDLLRIQFAQGRIAWTYVPPLETAGPVAFVIGARDAFIRPFDLVPGYIVPDGAQARVLTGPLTSGGPLVPGPPGAQAAWITAGPPTAPALSLVTLTGHRYGPSIGFRPGGQELLATAVTDGRGYVLVYSSSFAVHDVGPGWDRQLPGTLVAVGAASWLVAACNAQHQPCHNEVIDISNGSQRILAGPAVEPPYTSWPPTGVIAPDGRTAAVAESGRSGVMTVHLLDLRTGTTTDLSVSLGTPGGLPLSDQSMAWSPDSRWLFVAARGKLVVVNAATGKTASLGVSLPTVDQVAIRR